MSSPTRTPRLPADGPWAPDDPRLLIDGALVPATGGARYENLDPSTGEAAGEAPDATVADMEHAIAAARRAFDEGRWASDPDFRRTCLRQLLDALTNEKETLRRAVVTEAGTPIALTHGVQLQTPLDDLAHWAEQATAFAYERPLSDTDDGRRLLRYEPIGVVGAITPWNYPLYLNIAEIAPALAAGNTVVLKPAPATPWSGTELARIANEHTDIPPGVLNVITSSRNEVGELLTSSPAVDMITFTGSTATGRRVLASAAATVKKTFLELGGKSAHVVLDDAVLEQVLPQTAAAICVHSGQGCTLSTRVLLPRSRYEEGLEILSATMGRIPVGDVWDPATLQGPQISAEQREKVLGLIQSGLASGARLVLGGGTPAALPDGFYVEPTLLADVDPSSRIAQEEVFGPVLVALAYDDEEEAIAIANGTPYGLAGEVSSADDERALSVARRLRAGSIAVNGGSYFSVTTPLGGYGQSGLGRRNGDVGFEEYMELKAIGLPARP